MTCIWHSLLITVYINGSHNLIILLSPSPSQIRNPGRMATWRCCLCCERNTSESELCLARHTTFKAHFEFEQAEKHVPARRRISRNILLEVNVWKFMKVLGLEKWLVFLISKDHIHQTRSFRNWNYSQITTSWLAWEISYVIATYKYRWTLPYILSGHSHSESPNPTAQRYMSLSLWLPPGDQL